MIDFSDMITGTHILFGAVAVLAGTIALSALKGAPVHVKSGRVFTVTMIVASAMGAVLGLLKFETHYITFHAGILGVTLIMSSWLTLRAQTYQLAFWSAGVGIVNGLNTLAIIAAGVHALSLPNAVLLGFHASDYFLLSLMAGIAVIGDIRLYLSQSISRKQQLARHLWRMCLGFFIAAGSAFTGPGASIFPESVQQSGVLALPELIIICLMLFWFLRTLFSK